jgi:hypothetical protein
LGTPRIKQRIQSDEGYVKQIAESADTDPRAAVMRGYRRNEKAVIRQPNPAW